MTERYLPLYRKYRPQTFLDLIGQENIVKAFSNAIKLGKISHAYLLCGPRGTGKTSSARILAKSLNCAEGPTLTPCGKCPSCQDILNSNPIDVIEIDAASNRKVEDARNILEKIQFVPVHGRYKIYIIDEVHMLTPEAFNTLLKTLEEPPENVIFILATTEPHKVLDTIISRCQRFDFRRITNDDIVNRMKYIAQQENINISDDALSAIARSSAGGMRDSLALLDQISVADTERQITPEDVNELLGRLSYDVLLELSSCILNADTQNAILILDKIYNKGNEPLQIISNLIQFYRNMLVVKNCSDRNIAIELTQLSEQNILKLREQSENTEIEQLLYIIERLSAYSKEIKETTNRYLWLELCIIELSSNVKYSSYAMLLERIEKLESGVSQGTAPAALPRYNPPAQKVQQPAAQKYTPPAPQVLMPKSAQSVQNEPVMKPAAAQHVAAQNPPAAQDIADSPVQPAVSEQLPSPQPLNTVQAEQNPEPPAPVEVHQEEENAQIHAPSGDMFTNWQGVLQNIESVPSRMFFYNLSKPVSVTPEEMVIVFGKEIFVRQAKEDSKHLPLKKAALAFFGVPDIKITIRLGSHEELEAAKPVINFEKKTEPAPVQAPDTVEEENAQYLEETMKQKTKAEKKISAADYSDQARMVLDVFNGKVIE